MKFFAYDQVNERIRLNDEGILLVRDFAKLMEADRNKSKTDLSGKKKERAFKEFTFLYLFFDWESPYFQYSETDKYNESVSDSGLNENEMLDETFRSACRKYDEMQNSSRIGKLLKSALNTIDKITMYLDTLDLNERDPISGKPVFKTKDVIAEIGSASKLIEAIKTLEIQFKKEAELDTSLRGDKEPGMFDRT